MLGFTGKFRFKGLGQPSLTPLPLKPIPGAEKSTMGSWVLVKEFISSYHNRGL